MTCNYGSQQVKAVGKTLGRSARAGEGRMRSGIGFRGKRTRRQTLTRRTENMQRRDFPMWYHTSAAVLISVINTDVRTRFKAAARFITTL